MADFPYTQVSGKLSDLLHKLPQVGKPSKVTVQWLKELGFTSSYHRSLIPVLKAMGFVDTTGTPTGRWDEYRDARTSRTVLAAGIREAYRSLFEDRPNALGLDNKELSNFFGVRGNLGKKATAAAVATFKALCKDADFGAEPVRATEHELAPGGSPGAESATPAMPSGRGVTTVNINIELELPATQDEMVYEKLFAAMRKYLIE